MCWRSAVGGGTPCGSRTSSCWRRWPRNGRAGFGTCPPRVILVGLVLLTVALAGPTADTKVPRNRATVMLAIDVSLSMESTDVAPNRLDAAKEAATQFVKDLTPGVNLGLVSFAGISTVLVSPTTDRAPAIAAIAALKLDERTATGRRHHLLPADHRHILEDASAVPTVRRRRAS